MSEGYFWGFMRSVITIGVLLVFILITQVIAIPIKEEMAKTDCYLLEVSGNGSCRSGYFALTDSFFGDEDEVIDDYDDSSRVVLCCPDLDTSEERVRTERPFLWPNEIKGTLSRAWMSCDATNVPGLDTIRFLLYTRLFRKDAGLFDYEEIKINDVLSLRYSGFKKDAQVKIIIHGFTSSAFVGPAPILRAAYSTLPDPINIIAVHWEALANVATATGGFCYDIASQSTRFVGKKTAQLIDFLIESNYATLDKIHVMGHSLGSHCSGFTGKYLKSGRLRRLTAFDPARPSFTERPPSERLDLSDAEFIDVIHTSTKQWKLLGILTFGLLPFPVGIREPMGHSDFYPNFGTYQPGCILQFQKIPPLCSHSRSYYYYADSIRYRTNRAFLAVECDNLENLENRMCTEAKSDVENGVIMGEYMPIDNNNNSTKLYYVKTNSRSPFPVTIINSSSE